MTLKQYKVYKKVESRETTVRAIGPPNIALFHKNPQQYNKEKTDFIKAQNYLLSRLISNCYYNDIDVKKTYKIKDGEKIKVNKTLPDLIHKEGGWISHEKLLNKNLLNISPKISHVLLNLIKNLNSKHVIYSFYKTKGGIQLIFSLLKHCGIKAEIFSGDIDAKKREDILNKFNSIDNRRGKLIKVLLVTEAGAEGISIFECNNIHILESSPKENRTRQAIGRVIRYKSHEKLPADEQYVNVWRYWSTIPKSENKKEALVDELLYKRGISLENQFNEFTDRLIKNSIEKYEL
jgi:superfamily II DNA or RNA helicase